MIVDVLVPAKINLGLEILGKRPDGFHEIRSVMAAVSLFDRLRVQAGEQVSVHVDNPALSGEANLVDRAIHLVRSRHPEIAPAIALRKRIPVAAGLGGASSDAAATLVALDRCFGLDAHRSTLLDEAAMLGSDVPFFLSDGVALISGRGELISPLPRIRHRYAVIVAPNVVIPNKTATLYRALRSSDFSDGQRVETLAAAIPFRAMLDPGLLANAFQRALYEMVPALAGLPAALKAMGATVVALTGAGPAHYALEPDLERAHSIARAARAELPRGTGVHVVRFLARGMLIREGGRI